MLRCEVGDLSGKHARLNVGSGKQFYTDPSLPLFGEMSGKGKTLTPTYISIVSRGSFTMHHQNRKETAPDCQRKEKWFYLIISQ